MTDGGWKRLGEASEVERTLLRRVTVALLLAIVLLMWMVLGELRTLPDPCGSNYRPCRVIVSR